VGWPEERRSAHHSGSCRFPVFVTGDRNLEHQQNLASRRLGVVVRVAMSHALEDLLPLVPEALTAVARIQQGQVLRVPRADSDFDRIATVAGHET
jgi:hypothetical protein